jgi:hypothetical protein
LKYESPENHSFHSSTIALIGVIDNLKHDKIIMQSINASMSDCTRYLLPTDAVRDATDPMFFEGGAMAIHGSAPDARLRTTICHSQDCELRPALTATQGPDARRVGLHFGVTLLIAPAEHHRCRKCLICFERSREF